MANDTLKRIGKKICDDYLGFYPTSDSTKPPHIANGLFRACTGETCDTSDVHRWLIGEGRKNGIPSETIIHDYYNILANGQQEKATNIKELRYFLYEIFDQDNTIYPKYDFSVMSISSHWMIRGRLNSEAHIGDFIFSILAKKINGKRSPIIPLIQSALSNDSDDLTNLVKPIIAFPSEKEKRNIIDVQFPEDSEIQWDCCKERIRNGFDCLANNIKVIGESNNSLLVLRRIVNYFVFASFLYLIQENSAAYGGERPPIMLDAGINLDSIRRASEQSFTMGKKSVEEYFVNSIHEILNEEIADDTESSCRQWIADMVFPSSLKEDNIKKSVTSYFNSFCLEETSAVLALARALQIALYTFEYKNNSPSAFCRVLGVRCGLVGPKGNRATIKRYLLNSFTLETITLSTLNCDELKDGIVFRSLSERLIDTYNILIGADAEKEYAILENYNIAQSTPGDLRGDLSLNAQTLANTYISLGLGKQYADGVTLIGWRL